MKRIEIEDIAKYRIPSDIHYSPDGTRAVFTVTSSQEKLDGYQRDLWMMENGKARQLTASMDSSFLLWQDNTHLLLTRKTGHISEGCTEVFRLDVTGGEALPYLTIPFDLNSMKQIAEGLYAAEGIIDSEMPDLYQADEKERSAYFKKQKENQDYAVLDEVPYWQNGMHYTNKKRTALFLIDAGKELKITRITDSFMDAGDYLIHGSVIYYTASEWKNRLNLYAKIWAYDTESGSRYCMYDAYTHALGKLFMLQGRLYVQASDMKQYGVNQTMDLCEVRRNALIKAYIPEASLNNSVIGDTCDDGYRMEVRNDVLYTLATVENHTEIWALNAAFEKKVLFDHAGMVTDFDLGSSQIAMVYQDWNHVAELYVMNLDGSALRRVTSLNQKMLEGRYIAHPERIDFTSQGIALTGWVLLPENYDASKQYPAVLDIHGGPRCAYGETFFHEMQVWASLGYLVMFTNIRGSDGRGDAFADIRDQYGQIDYQNLMDFTDAVEKHYPSIDPSKVCVTGGSYGGFMTNWIITQTNRFCCAVSQRSISNWISMGFISDIGLYFSADQCGAASPFDFEKQWAHSPLKYAEQVQTPTLFLHSDWDHRCPLDQGMQMMQALAYRNIETRMVVFHKENHELSRTGRPEHRIRRLKEMTDWFQEHTK